jgi:hypothetical protein
MGRPKRKHISHCLGCKIEISSRSQCDACRKQKSRERKKPKTENNTLPSVSSQENHHLEGCCSVDGEQHVVKQHAINDEQHAINDEQHAINDKQHAINDEQHPLNDEHPIDYERSRTENNTLPSVSSQENHHLEDVHEQNVHHQVHAPDPKESGTHVDCQNCRCLRELFRELLAKKEADYKKKLREAKLSPLKHLEKKRMPRTPGGFCRRRTNIRNLLKSVLKAALNNDWKLLGRCFEDEELEMMLQGMPEVKKRLEQQVLEKISEGIGVQDVLEICDKGLKLTEYRSLFKLGRLFEILPAPNAILQERNKLSQTIKDFKPEFTLDGVALDPLEVIRWLVKAYNLKNGDQICISWDARKIKKGGLSGSVSQTAIYLIPKKKDLPLSRAHCYKIFLYWGSDNRASLERNSKKLQDFLKNCQSRDSFPYGEVKLEDGKSIRLRFTVAADYVALLECFPHPHQFCIWCACDPKNNGDKGKHWKLGFHNRTCVPRDALFHIYRVNIRPCLLHLKKRIVEHHINLAIRKFNHYPCPTKEEKKIHSEQQASWEHFCRTKIGMSNYKFSSDDYKISLTGKKASLFLEIGHQGLKILDSSKEVMNIWKKMKQLVKLIEQKKVTEKDLKKLKEYR